MKLFPRMLSVRLNRFRVCSACACYNFLKITQKSQIKLQISTKKNRNFEKPFRNPSYRTHVNILKKNLVPRMLSHRENVRNSGENRRKRNEIFLPQSQVEDWFELVPMHKN